MSEKQQTLKKSVSISGTGLHTGLTANLTFKPAPENVVIKFQRVDLKGSPIIHASIDNVVDTARGTTLEENDARIYTTEHVLAALTGLGIDNVLIEMDKDESPIMDGSSHFFVKALLEAGIEKQNAEREYIIIDSEVIYTDVKNKIAIRAIPDDHYNIDVTLNYETKVLGEQKTQLNNITEFKEKFSKCRTFVFLHELEFLLSNNLIKGGNLDNAIVFVKQRCIELFISVIVATGLSTSFPHDITFPGVENIVLFLLSITASITVLIIPSTTISVFTNKPSGVSQ